MLDDKEEQRPNQPGQGGGKNQAVDPKEQQHGELVEGPEKQPNEGSGIPESFTEEYPDLSQKIKPMVNGEMDHLTPASDDLQSKKD
ncbi:MAG: hypothetical protein SFW35_12145 [Chitinophagales bacterium]|nr:hypothetical protein [Chitinophagales bacterium]